MSTVTCVSHTVVLDEKNWLKISCGFAFMLKKVWQWLWSWWKKTRDSKIWNASMFHPHVPLAIYCILNTGMGLWNLDLFVPSLLSFMMVVWIIQNWLSLQWAKQEAEKPQDVIICNWLQFFLPSWSSFFASDEELSFPKFVSFSVTFWTLLTASKINKNWSSWLLMGHKAISYSEKMSLKKLTSLFLLSKKTTSNSQSY